MEVSRSSVCPRCSCELPECESAGHHASTLCGHPAEVICHAFGLAAPMCGACREQWERAVPGTIGQPTFEPLEATPPKATELRTPKGKTFPRAARVLPRRKLGDAV